MDLLIRLREWGRRGGDGSATPTLPTAWLLDAPAADLIQRPSARAVSLLMELIDGKLAEEPSAQDNFSYLFNAKGVSPCVARCSSPFWQLFPL